MRDIEVAGHVAHVRNKEDLGWENFLERDHSEEMYTEG
jgi:hypothetical protein